MRPFFWTAKSRCWVRSYLIKQFGFTAYAILPRQVPRPEYTNAAAISGMMQRFIHYPYTQLSAILPVLFITTKMSQAEFNPLTVNQEMFL